MKRNIFGVCVLVSLAACAWVWADGPATQQAGDGAGVIRVKAGADKAFTDRHGHVWQADAGFDGGDTASRDDDLKIENTDMPAFYRCEHFDMTGWSGDVPNGTYTVKLYFCETFDEITSAGERVFNVKVGDQQLKDFDIFKVAGGADKPVIKTFDNVVVKDGKLKIGFEANVQSPEINGIEIIPNK